MSASLAPGCCCRNHSSPAPATVCCCNKLNHQQHTHTRDLSLLAAATVFASKSSISLEEEAAEFSRLKLLLLGVLTLTSWVCHLDLLGLSVGIAAVVFTMYHEPVPTSKAVQIAGEEKHDSTDRVLPPPSDSEPSSPKAEQVAPGSDRTSDSDEGSDASASVSVDDDEEDGLQTENHKEEAPAPSQAIVNAQQVLLRSNARIRKGYLDRLGIGEVKPIARPMDTMGIHARRAAAASARARRKPPSMRLKLKDSPEQSASFGQSLFRKFAFWTSEESWPRSDDDDESENKIVSRSSIRSRAISESTARAARASRDRRLSSKESDELSSAIDKPGSNATSSTRNDESRPSALKRNMSTRNREDRAVVFLDEADVYWVPARSEISPRVRSKIWHSRDEFINMVMRNMDEMETEMQQQLEAQQRLEDLRRNPPPSLRRGSLT